VEKPSQLEEGKITDMDQTVHASFTMSNLGIESSLEHLEITTHSDHRPSAATTTIFCLLYNQQTILKPQIPSISNLVDK
jgi:hypothetical protein